MIEINMQMPEKCGLCPCFHAENPMYCQAVKADKNKKIVSPYGAPRPEWCPLKEQEEITVHDPGAYCQKCGWMLYPEDHPHHCGNCGQDVKWI